MDLCNAIQTKSLDVIKALIARQGFTTDSEWLDYDALNSALKFGRKDVVRLLLQKNCRVNPAFKFSTDTPLHNAIQLADPELISDLLERKAFIAVLNTDGNSPLHLAFLQKQEKSVDVMLGFIEKNSIFSNPSNIQGLTHLHIACTRNNAKAIEGFLNNGASAEDLIRSDSVLWAGYNAFHFAAEFKSLTAIKVLMRHSSVEVSVAKSQQDCFGKTPLQLINQQLEELSIMASLVSNSGFSPFHAACVGKDSQLVKNFLENNLSPNDRSLSLEKFCTSYSPLHLATKSTNSEILVQLLKHGADNACRNEDEMTPVQLALYSESSTINDHIVRVLYNTTKNKLNQMPDRNGLSFLHAACAINDQWTAQQFLSKGVDVNGKVTYERQRLYHYTPLHFAIKYKHLDMVEYLVERGADVNCGKDCVDGTPLLLACKVGRKDIIDFLIENGADVETVRAHDKKTPLHLFVESCFDQRSDWSTAMKQCISKLVKVGIDVNARDVDGDTVLHLACSRIYGMPCNYAMIPCLRLLLEIGADINVENNSEFTPFDCQLSEIWTHDPSQPSDRMILFYHVQKMKAFGCRVNPKNDECCKRLIVKRRFRLGGGVLEEEEFARKRQRKIDEIKLEPDSEEKNLDRQPVERNDEIDETKLEQDSVNSEEEELAFQPLERIDELDETKWEADSEEYEEKIIPYPQGLTSMLLDPEMNPKNETGLERLLEEQSFRWDEDMDVDKEAEFARQRQREIDEIEELKSITLTNNAILTDVTLYDFLRFDPRRAKDYLAHDIWLEVLRKDFPVHGHLLRLQYQRAFECIGVVGGGSNRRRAEDAGLDEDQTGAKRRREESA